MITNNYKVHGKPIILPCKILEILMCESKVMRMPLMDQAL